MTTGKEFAVGRFRGVPFYIDDGDRSGGRRVASHQFPLRDTPFTQDMGREQRGTTLNIVLVGNGVRGDGRRYESVEKWCEDLINALEAAGPGKLVHPRLGEVSMQPGKYRVPDDFRTRNIIRLTAEFMEPGDQVLQPRVISYAMVNAQADALQTIAAAAFVDEVAVSDQPVSVLERARAAIANVVSFVENTRAQARQIQAASQRAQALLTQPANLAFSLISSVRIVSGSAFNPVQLLRGQMNFLRAVIDRRPSTPITSATGAENATAARNEAAMFALVAAGVLGEAARVLSGTITTGDDEVLTGAGFGSADEALAARDEFLDLLDGIECLVPDPVYASCRMLRAQVVKDMTARTANLAHVRRHTLDAALPALLVAQQLYGDGSRADDIIQRNGIRHPLFVPAGVMLEVLDV
jgi:prophage DNA circulation protein